MDTCQCASLYVCVSGCVHDRNCVKTQQSPPAVSGPSPSHAAVNLPVNPLFFHLYLPRCVCVSVHVCGMKVNVECFTITLSHTINSPYGSSDMLNWCELLEKGKLGFSLALKEIQFAVI